MAASYPSSAKSFTTKLDGAGNTIFAAHVNDLQDEVVAMESALVTNGVAHGLKPSSAGAQDLGTASLPWGTVRTRALNFAAVSTLTIASGVVTATRSHHEIDTESAAASDDLDTITATGLTDGFVLVLRPANVARVVTLKDGTGNLLLNGNYAMSATDRTITLMYDGTNWRELGRSFTAASPTTAYAVTVANVTTTASADQPILSFTVPASAMSDGDVIEIVVPALVKNNKGTNGTVITKLFWGASSVQIGNDSWTNNASERKWLGRFSLVRVGADIWVRAASSGAKDDYEDTLANLTNTGDNVAVISAPTFNSDQTVSVKLTLSAADASFYYKPQSARALRTAAS